MANLGFRHKETQKGNGAKAANGVVPRQFFDRMAAQLSDDLGPAAPAAVANEVARLRESMDAFPLARVWELAQRLSEEIIEKPRKERFLRTMSQEIRTLPSR